MRGSRNIISDYTAKLNTSISFTKNYVLKLDPSCFILHAYSSYVSKMAAYDSSDPHSTK